MTTQEPASSDASLRRDSAAQTTEEILQRVFYEAGKLGIAVRLWDGQALFAGGGPTSRATLVLTHPGALRRMLLPPNELRLGEAYLRGDFDIEGDVIAILSLADLLDGLRLNDLLFLVRRLTRLPRSQPPQVYTEGRQRARLRGDHQSQ